ncbi:hypothetical protein [Mucilaginibacter celer]|uniref:Secretion system C-terminal sorting domain-containing protein n=1 Tax=Mucilaginibacter celer TaxID=2305508 RepID=A0A494W6K5_9SPHI|nr:hypothetical protein [Mucilaginibacter celer]AYL98932.1 hypothetical protein HYN43_028275 [Mucilaginibacter celer]
MKTSIKLSALFLLLSAGVFAATAAKAADVTPKAKEVVSFSVLGNDRGIKMDFAKSATGKSFVRVYNKENELLLKDYVSTKTDAAKGYVLSELADGDYKIEIKSNNQVVTKTLHIYHDGDQQSFFIVQE